MDVSMIFAKKLRQRRRELGLTQREVGEMLGYSEKTVSKWESGAAICPSESLPALAKALKTDINSLLTETESGKYFLGVDGGGTKTDFVLADSQGRILSRVTLGASNPNDLGMKAACDVLSGGIREVIGDIPASSISAFIGIAGGTTGNNREKLREYLSHLGFGRFDNGNDAECAVKAALGDEDGCVVIAGTGSVAFTQMGGELKRLGGFGYLFEQGGSGYTVGRDSLTHALELESVGGEDRLTLELRSELGAGTVTERLGDIYSGGKKLIASLSGAVTRAWRDGDEAAKRIIERNMRCIAHLIESSERVYGEAARRVVLMGGLISAGEDLLPLIINSLEYPERYDVTVSRTPPYVGALLLARRNYAKD